MATIQKEITAFGEQRLIGCDGQCDKAWGVNARPRSPLSDDPDDYAFLADTELGMAPVTSGTTEGADHKPTMRDDRLNKWCYRQCERCSTVKPGEKLKLRDFSRRLFNQPKKHPEEAKHQLAS